MTRTKPKTERRADLLDAAEKLIIERDINQLTVEDITTAAGVSKGTYYLYFSTKDDVIASLRERYITRLMERQEAAVNRLSPGDWAGRVETWLVTGVQDYLNDPGLHNALFHHVGPQMPTHADRERSMPPYGQIEALTSMLESGTRAGVFNVVDPQATAVLLFGAVHHAADYLHHEGDTAMVDRLLMELRHWCRMVTRNS
ncbi:TetR/AcrR family transcriptional regulator [Micromonospora craniellae]|uniref:TetR/AcrR family transcriptional regulator n=1 Tax=Micromonospora craniellae TaxID=2294034 RepID=A0A372FXZ2_9ACTN|nr:TetR/AcrR family transcriptional regulator [Micromonospora craniellae]RFS45603.1 TetR/AcrR family transcriptional regulator [Micromonospora craniellae]